MKVAVISSGVLICPPPGYSGLEALAYQQAEGLAARGHDVTLYAPEGSHTEKAKLYVMCKPGQWEEHPAFNEYWRTLFDYDVIIDNGWNKWPMTLKQEGVLKCPVLNWAHAPVNTMFGSLPPGVDRPCFVCISKDQADHFRALYEHEAKVCYNGVDPDYYRATGVPRTDRFLFVARFSSIKCPDIAIRACLEAGVGLDLVGDNSITGEPHVYEECVRLAATARPNQIRIVGPASRGEVVGWMSQAHAFLHPQARYREPFGLSPVEAQLCGCPVIAWDRGALRETVRHGETGWLVRNEKDLAAAIQSAKDGISLGMRTRCREWAMQFSVINMVSRVEELCNEALATGGW